MIPDKILGYKINRLIGEGGMAKVYEADLDSKLGTKVAIKVLDRHLASEESLRERFRQEAKSMLQLKHPYIVNILNFVEEENMLAIIMEYIEGQSLKEMVDHKGPVNIELAKQIFISILEAMQYVHNKGVVHRDIKPSNIFIIEGKYPKILDFGIVKVMGGESTTKTKTGLTIGTPMYMSPEQIQTPQNIDYRTDIYSLGVTLYYMLAGNPPYDITESEFGIQSKVVKELLPILTGIPANISNTISLATRKSREDRIKSCDLFKQLLLKNNYDDPDKTNLLTQSHEVTNPITPENKDSSKNRINVLNNKAREYEQRGLLRMAVKTYEEVLVLDSQNQDISKKVIQLNEKIEEQRKKDKVKERVMIVVGIIVSIVLVVIFSSL